MFIAIEGKGAAERYETAQNKRKELLSKLWEITCCEIHVFNRATFDEA